MDSRGKIRGPIRFGVYEADLAGRTLRKSGVRVHLQEKPFRVLAMLLDRPEEVVTRKELQKELWPNDEYGQFDLGLNTAVKKVRAALGDSGDSPKWIETVPKVGYKFLGALETRSTTVSPAPAEIPPNKTPTVRWLAFAAGFLVAALLGLIFVVASGQPEESEQGVYRFTVDPPEGTVIRSLELSPNGRHLAFIAEKRGDVRLWLRSFKEPTSRLIEGSEGTDARGAPFWSPDSRNIGFFAEGKLKRVGIAGEPPVVLADARGGRGGSWNEDGTILFAPTPQGRGSYLYTIPDAGGRPQQASEGQINSHRSPLFLPGGRQFIFHHRIAFYGGGGAAEIRLGELGRMETKVLAEQRLQASYMPSNNEAHGYLLTLKDGVLMAQPFEADSGGLSGAPFPTVRKVGFDVAMSRALFSASRSGSLAYLAEDGPNRVWELFWLDRRGEVIRGFGVRALWTSMGVRISPDGARAAVSTATIPGRGATVEILDLADGSNLQVGAGLWFAWSPDGLELAQWRNDELRTLKVDASSGVGPHRGPQRRMVWDWSRDGRWILLEDRSEDDRDVLVMNAKTGEVRPFLASKASERSPRFSPDGRFVSYSSNESVRDEVYVVRFPEGTGKRKVSFDGGAMPVWRPDGKELYFASSQADLMAASVETDGGAFRSTRPEPLFPIEHDPRMRQEAIENFPVWGVSLFDASADGQRFLVARGRVESIPSPVNVVVNWREELRRIAEEAGQ